MRSNDSCYRVIDIPRIVIMTAQQHLNNNSSYQTISHETLPNRTCEKKMEEDLIVMDGETRRGGAAMWAQVGASVRCTVSVRVMPGVA
jgi:hypothetical protein